MRSLPPVLALLAGFALACGNAELSTAPIPLDLDTVRDRHDPPDVVVAERTITRPAGGGACGHSPLCVIILPVLLYDAVFPDKYLELTVDELAQRTLTASYTTDGDLLQARLRGVERWQDYRVLELDQLGKDVTVQVSSAPLDSPDDTVATPILPQVDLLGDYREALAVREKADSRTALVIEAMTWLGEEAAPLVEERLADPTELDSTRAEVLQHACKHGGAEPLLPLVQEQPGVETALAAVACGSRQPVFAVALVDGLCARDDLELARLESVGRLAEDPGLAGVVAERVAACASPDGKAVLTHALGLPLDTGTVAAALAVNSRRADWFARQISPEWPSVRPALAGAFTGPNARVMAKAADGILIVPTPAEGQVLAAAATEPDPKLSFGRAGERAVMLSLLSRMPDDQRTTLAASLPPAASFYDHALRVVLGQAEHQLPVARELSLAPAVRAEPGTVSSDAALAAWVLSREGCGEYQVLREVRDLAQAAAEGSLGQVCPR